MIPIRRDVFIQNIGGIERNLTAGLLGKGDRGGTGSGGEIEEDEEEEEAAAAYLGR